MDPAPANLTGFEIEYQPDEETCGATCLHSIYRHFGNPLSLERLREDIVHLPGGGTHAAYLGCHALRQGFSARLYTYNLQVFDPTWFNPPPIDLSDRLEAQMRFKADPLLHTASRAHLEFLRLGGQILYEDITPRLLEEYFERGVPILCGLSATYLYRFPREFGPGALDDDIRGLPTGHFVVLCGDDRERDRVTIADPVRRNPFSHNRRYEVSFEHLLVSICLGVLTFDANLLIVEPGPLRQDPPCPT